MKNVLQFLKHYNSRELSEPLKNKDMMLCWFSLISKHFAYSIALTMFLVLPLSLRSQNNLPSSNNNIEGDYIIPNNISSITITTIGGNGGGARVLNGCEYQGGKGAKLIGTFLVADGCNEGFTLSPGGTLRFIKGGNGSNYFDDERSSGSGGAGSAVFYRGPSDTSWFMLMVAGGGGGAYAYRGLIGDLCVGGNGRNAELGLGGSQGLGAFGGFGGNSGSGGLQGGIEDSGGGGGAFGFGTPINPNYGGGAGWFNAGEPISALGGRNPADRTGGIRNGGDGFGGGGSGNFGGGGGGGFSGGGGGSREGNGAGGGAGSFLSSVASGTATSISTASQGSISYTTVPTATTLTTYYQDLDGDSYGNPNVSVQSCTQPANYVLNNTDCNDTNATIYPNAPEVCDGLDNNCDGQIDEGLSQSTYYADNDNDGFGNPNSPITACSAPPGFVEDSADCDDTDGSINDFTINCPSDVTYECGEEPTTLFVDPEILGGCGITDTQVQLSREENCSFQKYTKTWTFTGSNGITKSCTQVITITDTAPPALPTAPADLNLDCAEDVPSPVQLTAIDACKGNITVSPTDEITLGNPAVNDYTIVRTWTFEDCSDVFSVSQTIIVKDNTAPQITCPGNITVDTDSGECTATVTFEIPEGTDNCSGVTTVQTAGPESGSEFPVGTTTITFEATDAAGNTATCSFDVVVENITTETTVTVTPNEQQYSDKVTLRAEVSPYDCGDAGTLGGMVTFKIGTQVMGTANLIDGVAELVDVPLLETSPVGQLAPGNRTVSAHFSTTNTNFIVNDPDNVILNIKQENALVDYTGQTLQATPSSSLSTATVVLSANIQDINDGTRGDIRNAKVMFFNRDTNTPISGWIPVANLINANDTTLGTVSYSWTTTISGDSQSYTIGIIVDNGYYIRNASEDDTVVTIYIPVGDFITGGGYIRPNSSSGLYASTSGLKTNFGFNVGYNKKGNKLKGHMNIIFRRMESDGIVHVYQIKSNSIESLGVNVSNANQKIGTFITKSNLMDITDPLNIISIGGNLILKVDLTDRGNPGTNDEIAFNLTNNGTLIYSSNWTGISTSKMLLSGGNLVIQSGFSLGSASRNTQDESVNVNTIEFGPFEVKGWPNPSDDQFNIQLKTNNVLDEVSIKVYDLNGRLVHTNVFKPEQQYSFGKELKSGMYFVNISQQDASQTLRMVKY